MDLNEEKIPVYLSEFSVFSDSPSPLFSIFLLLFVLLSDIKEEIASGWWGEPGLCQLLLLETVRLSEEDEKEFCDFWLILSGDAGGVPEEEILEDKDCTWELDGEFWIELLYWTVIGVGKVEGELEGDGIEEEGDEFTDGVDDDGVLPNDIDVEDGSLKTNGLCFISENKKKYIYNIN